MEACTAFAPSISACPWAAGSAIVEIEINNLPMRCRQALF